ncbi:membrane protein insertion efficiency factor YidD [Roseitalea porphyridii]|uniref:Membrane protein insertion efficiency factor YidD n=1 Tax=Roseitalea porphyridii TaxID=1852022 RepID=A0A4V1A3X0_9HYPH|nr:membrane protein insertion efficiency factor YidD [Roseitalea porphyridii]
MATFGGLVASYVLVVTFIGAYRWWTMRSATIQRGRYSDLSVRWAWDPDLHEFDGIRFPTPDQYWLAKPHKLLPVFMIVAYQIATRLLPGSFSCPQEPNCSNYAIGLIRRHGIAPALAHATKRVRDCGSHIGLPHFNEED